MFNITIDQTVDVTWYINGTNQDTNTSVTAANYTNTSAETGVWNISAVAENANGTDMQTWVWNVTGENTPTAWTLNISESVDFNATGYDHNNDRIDPANLTFGWSTTPTGVGTLNATTGSVVNFTARHAGRTEIYALNGSVSSNETCKVWITVNVPPEPRNVDNGTGNATSGNSTAIVWLNNRSINGTIIIEEIGDPINKTEDIGNRTGLGIDTKPVKGANVTVNGNIVAAVLVLAPAMSPGM